MLRGFIAFASRADVYTTSASASNVSVYTNTICVAKRLLGSTQTLELHPMDAGCAIASLNSSAAIQDRSTLSITPLSLFIHLVHYRLCVCASGSLITDIFSCRAEINVSCLHLGQYNGKFSRTVSSRIRTRVLESHTGHNIHVSIIALYRHSCSS